MNFHKRLSTIAGWLVFGIAMVMYYSTAERVGSLWDCGEFITGAYKLEVVHPPGAPLFMIVGRMFTWFATLVSNDPTMISFSINLLSGLCSAGAAAFIAWSTIALSKMALTGRDEEPTQAQSVAMAGAGLVAGLVTAFSISVWFSAVEGEVYAMSTFFTAMTMWALFKWYAMPDTADADRWILFCVYSAGLSVGVHLLSMLTFPGLAMFYYFKKYKEHTVLGTLVAAITGVALIVAIQKFIITGIPALWAKMDVLMVNSFGLPFHSGLIPTAIIIALVIYFGLMQAEKRKSQALQMVVIGGFLAMIGFSTIGVIVLRANSNTPINMNNPSDATRLLPYVNREQYGERPLLRGPNFDVERPISYDSEERYGRKGDSYEIVDEKVTPQYSNDDKVFFPRMSDGSQGRPSLYRAWIGKPTGELTGGDNITFFMRYQIGWMYWRYFLWNFVGRQNATQGYYPWDVSKGHWSSGVQSIDEARLYNMEHITREMKENKGTNHYYFIPLILGLIGLVFHMLRKPEDAIGLISLFIIMGIGIIVYSNQPPNEPRERDYVLVGSFFTFAIWVGMAVIPMFELLKNKLKAPGMVAAGVSIALACTAPFLMGSQGSDDMDRSSITGSRDYAANFLNSCAKDAIIFTYGDNDTYPLWYAQEVENIRRDVRVVNLSLIQVDWYIEQLTRKMNDSPPIKLTIPLEAYRGRQRNQVPYYNPQGQDRPTSTLSTLKLVSESHPLQTSSGRPFDSYYDSKQLYIPVDIAAMQKRGLLSPNDTAAVQGIPVRVNDYLIKDELAILDVLTSNINERPIYFAVTCNPSKLMGLNDYMQLEGLALRVIPVRSESDRSLSIYGSGRVDADKVYDNVMNKFAWGNFDKKQLFVDNSYLPAVQSQRIVMLRAAQEFVALGQKQKGVDLVKQYFKSFPNMNFAYDYNAWYMIQVLLEAGAVDVAKPHIITYAKETADRLKFFHSIGYDKITSGFEDDYSFDSRSKNELFERLGRLEDKTLLAEVKGIFKEYYKPTQKYIDGLSNEVALELMKFNSMSPEQMEASRKEFSLLMELKDDMIQAADLAGNTQLKSQLESTFKAYNRR